MPCVSAPKIFPLLHEDLGCLKVLSFHPKTESDQFCFDKNLNIITGHLDLVLHV